MTIGILGHGHVGGALAKKWTLKGHNIIIFARNPDDEKTATLTQYHPLIHSKSIKELYFDPACDVLLIATPAHAVPGLLENMVRRDELLVIDATNSVRQRPEPFQNAFEAIREFLTIQVAKCFNTTGFENIEDPVIRGLTLDMFVAGDSIKAKDTAIRLSSDAGFENCYDFGGDAQVQALEGLAYAWINLAIFQGEGRGIGFKLLKR